MIMPTPTRTMRTPTRIEIAALRLFAVCLVLYSFWLVLPRRGHFLEEVVAQCKLQDGTLVRLFVDNGGATTSYWYSVTVQPGLLWTEYEVFNSYSSPVLTGLSCQADHVIARSGQANWKIAPSDVISGRSEPIAYSFGLKYSGASPMCPLTFSDWARIVFGVGLGMFAVVLVRWLWPVARR
jgi:hypothetical protein